MLIERMEAAGIPVVSANTDGIVVHMLRSKRADLDQVVWDWLLDTSFVLEETEYRLLAQRDVNSYVAVRTDGKAKRKGLMGITGLAKNPVFPIVAEAVVRFLAEGTPLVDTISAERDLRAFLAARRVTGGAVWRGEALGRVARWYLSSEVPREEALAYAKNSNKVPDSGGGRPCMVLPEVFPQDVDYRRYVAMAEEMLVDLGVSPSPPKPQRPLRKKKAVAL